VPGRGWGPEKGIADLKFQISEEGQRRDLTAGERRKTHARVRSMGQPAFVIVEMRRHNFSIAADPSPLAGEMCT